MLMEEAQHAFRVSGGSEDRSLGRALQGFAQDCEITRFCMFGEWSFHYNSTIEANRMNTPAPVSRAARVVGRSMEPTLFQGDLIELAPVTARGLASGEVYSFWWNERQIAHRLVGIDG